MKGLKNTLWVCAVIFLPSFIFALLPWQVVTDWFTQYGIHVPTDSFTVFSARLLYAVFGMIGVFFVILARNPLKYKEMLILAACGLILFGVTIFAGSPYNALPSIALITIVKAIFFFILGTLILLFRKEAIQANSTPANCCQAG